VDVSAITLSGRRAVVTGIGAPPVRRPKVRDRATGAAPGAKIRFIEGLTFTDGVA